MKKIAILSSIILLAACNKGTLLPSPIIKVDLENIQAPYFPVSYEVHLTANVSWRISENDVFEWVSPSISESRGSATMVLELLENDTDSQRSGKIVIVSDDNSIRREIQIVQRAASEKGMARISEVRSLERTGGYTILQGTIRGFVVTEPSASNYREFSFAMEDSFSMKNSGITVTVPEDKFSAPSQGEEVIVSLAGAMLSRDEDGILTLHVKDAPQKGGATSPVMQADSLSLEDIESGMYESMLVCIPACQVVEEETGGVLGSSPKITDEQIEHFGRMVVSPDAPFASQSYGKGGGSVTGIVGAVQNGITDIRPFSDRLIHFGTKRLGEKPGITGLPYVFSFYCSSQFDGACKYINYNKLYYNSETALTKGKIAEDRDPDIGVSLWMTAYAMASSNTLGPNMWAESGAHDNVNAAGFVSMDSKTVPPEECGWWLDVPLSFDLPEQFTVTFGMGGNTWSIATWSLYYSKDRENWFKGGDYLIDHIIEGGSYYLYYSIPIVSETDFVKGDVLYLKFVPHGTKGVGGSNSADGHGKSCFIRLHSAIIISSPEVQSSPSPAGDVVWFEPFDNLTGGVDYFIGDRVAALSNYPGKSIDAWSGEQLNSMSGHHVYERPGYAQIGFVDSERAVTRKEYVNVPGALESPQLGVSGNLSLTFDAAAYRTPAIRPGADITTSDVGHPDITRILVEVIGDGLIDGASSAVVQNISATHEFSHHTLKITGASPSTRIRFTSDPASGEFSRWFIDNITVTK